MGSLHPLHSRRAWTWLLGLLASATAGLLTTRALHRAAPAPVASAQPAAPAPAADAAIPADSDARVRDALANLTPREIFKSWLQQDHLLDRLAVVMLNLAEDVSPARELAFLRPQGSFRAVHRGSGYTLSPRSAGRYDAFANVIASLDERRVASAYRALHPLLESAYHALGYPGRPLDEVTTRALQRLVDAPVRDEVALRQVGSLWLFADERLEALGPVEKQLLRMGPRNTRLLQGEAREIAAALGLRLRGPLEAAAAVRR